LVRREGGREGGERGREGGRGEREGGVEGWEGKRARRQEEDGEGGKKEVEWKEEKRTEGAVKMVVI
jgi:hypothetical protein